MDVQNASSSSNNQCQDVTSLRFKEALAQLDQIVSSLESNTLELEESLREYKRGVELLTYLREKLDGAQQEVDMLMGKLDVRGDDTTTDTSLS
ncbi:MAG: exodeoxyribonuclease VII small subunit [Eggerthellales bacterium]|nr:exodeoxyribonuclease VII small subunit [Eggerthellales bacterium]